MKKTLRTPKKCKVAPAKNFCAIISMHKEHVERAVKNNDKFVPDNVKCYSF